MIGKKQICFLNLEKVLARPISGKENPEDWTDFRIDLKVLNRLIENYKGKYIFVYTFILDEMQGMKMKGILNMCYDYIYDSYDDRNIIFDFININYITFDSVLDDYDLNNYPKYSMFILGNSIKDRKIAEQYNIEYVNLNTFLNGV